VIEGGSLPQGGTAVVHKGLGLHEKHPLTAEICLRSEGVPLQPVDAHTGGIRQHIDGLKAHVVPGLFVFCAGVTQSANDGGHCAARGALRFDFLKKVKDRHDLSRLPKTKNITENISCRKYTTFVQEGQPRLFVFCQANLLYFGRKIPCHKAVLGV